ncbi:MAG: hypothetical protein H7A51_13495 [Akkermansiaceae bacterium]|nr:hypothetical protein [Akkermansiaceae bacterium]
MKRYRAYKIIGVLTALVVAYCSYSLRCFYVKPSLRYIRPVPVEAQVAVDQWYESADIPTLSMNSQSVLYALIHPHAPTDMECLAIYDSNEILIYSMIHDNYFAGFGIEDGVWVCLHEDINSLE